MAEIRLIDANALKKTLAKNLTIWAFNTSYDGVLAKVIDNAPTVEVTDYDTGYQDGLEDGLNDIRPKGEWITKEHSIEYYCSHCGERLDQCCENFCCHCGADMRGGGGDD